MAGLAGDSRGLGEKAARSVLAEANETVGGGASEYRPGLAERGAKEVRVDPMGW